MLITGGTGPSAGYSPGTWSPRTAYDLLLTSRRGRHAPGAAQLVEELTAMGARVTSPPATSRTGTRSPRCWRRYRPTPADRGRARRGVIDDGVLDALTPERVDAVLRPKVDAAWHLHELTRDLDLSAFVLFSSAAGVLGVPDRPTTPRRTPSWTRLAEHRRSLGLRGDLGRLGAVGGQRRGRGVE